MASFREMEMGLLTPWNLDAGVADSTELRRFILEYHDYILRIKNDRKLPTTKAVMDAADYILPGGSEALATNNHMACGSDFHSVDVMEREIELYMSINGDFFKRTPLPKNDEPPKFLGLLRLPSVHPLSDAIDDLTEAIHQLRMDVEMSLEKKGPAPKRFVQRIGPETERLLERNRLAEIDQLERAARNARAC